MPEPISASTAASIAASVSGVTMSLLGVPWHAVAWGFIGALMSISQMEPMPWYKAFLFGTLSTLAGAALGAFGAEMFNLQGGGAVILGSLVGGIGAFPIVNALRDRFTRGARGEK